jgi:hypothetical protein
LVGFSLAGLSAFLIDLWQDAKEVLDVMADLMGDNVGPAAVREVSTATPRSPI